MNSKPNSHTITHCLFIFNGVLEPEAVCQATQAHATTQAWQRVCLSQRTPYTTNNQTGKEEHQPVTAVWRNGGCCASYDRFVVISSAVLRLNFCAKNPSLLQAAKRYVQVVQKLHKNLIVKKETRIKNIKYVLTSRKTNR